MCYYYRYLIAPVALLVIATAASFAAAENRTFDGIGNNLDHPSWGSVESNFSRLAPVDYVDGISIPRIAGKPNPRSVGLALMRQFDEHPNARRLSGYVYAFGQFLTHDVQETVSGGTELIEFRIPANDDIFIPNQRIQMTRSIFDTNSGKSIDNPRQQVNFTTSYIDASAVYGSSEFFASVLRGGPANPGARLRTSNDINGDGENLLPRDAFGPVLNAPFVAGDSRVNDNIALTSIHTLFMREHNRLVGELALGHPDWSPEDLFQRARKIVGAQVQVITYNEFLPALLGPQAPHRNGIYDANLEASVLNEFAVVFLRIGHSMLTNDFKRIENDGRSATGGPLPLEEAFFDPTKLPTSKELDLFLKGLSVETQEETDLGLVDGMRVALLDAIDIQRARDHGLPGYNAMRQAYGLPPVASVLQITSNPDIQSALASFYPDVNSIDPFVGALAEDHLPGASVGPLVAAAFEVQFSRLRDGDRFWYENDPAFSAAEVSMLRDTRLSDIILRNTGVRNLQENVFFVPEPSLIALLYCALIPLVRRQLFRRQKGYMYHR
ncbi:MAG: peroxidase family protein [Pirellulales bacterium]